MFGTDYLSSFDGNLLPITNFEGCMFILFFTKSGSRKCFDIFIEMQNYNIERIFPNVVFVHISMDNTFHEWDTCVKNPNWLQFPFYPVNIRKQLFKTFRVDRLPFMIACSDIDNQIIIPAKDEDDTVADYIEFLILELSYYTNLLSIDDFVLI